MGIRIDIDSQIRSIQRIGLEKCRYVGLHTDGIRIHAGKQVIHGGISRHAHPVDMLLFHPCRPAHLGDQRIDGLLNHRVLKPFRSARLGRFNDTVDDIRAVPDLSVSGRSFSQHLSRQHVDQQRGNCGGSNIHRQAPRNHLGILRINIIHKDSLSVL